MPALKTVFGSEIRRFELLNQTFVELRRALITTYPSLPVAFSVKWLDEEDDLLTIGSDVELREAFRSASEEKKLLKLFLDGSTSYPKTETHPKTESTYTDDNNGKTCSKAEKTPCRKPEDKVKQGHTFPAGSKADAEAAQKKTDIPNKFLETIVANSNDSNGTSPPTSQHLAPPTFLWEALSLGPMSPLFSRFTLTNPPDPTITEAKTPPGGEERVSCHVCHKRPLVCPQFQCSICPGVTLCDECESKDGHPASHPLLKLKVKNPQKVSGVGGRDGAHCSFGSMRCRPLVPLLGLFLLPKLFPVCSLWPLLGLFLLWKLFNGGVASCATGQSRPCSGSFPVFALLGGLPALALLVMGPLLFPLLALLFPLFALAGLFTLSPLGPLFTLFALFAIFTGGFGGSQEPQHARSTTPPSATAHTSHGAYACRSTASTNLHEGPTRTPATTTRATAAAPASTTTTTRTTTTNLKATEGPKTANAAPAFSTPTPAAEPIAFTAAKETEMQHSVSLLARDVSLKALEAMGFAQRDLNLFLLEKHGGNVQEVVRWQLENMARNT